MRTYPNRLFFLLLLVVSSGAWAGTVGYEAPEWAYAESELIVHAVQQGELWKGVDGTIQSEFRVLKVLKGNYKEGTLKAFLSRFERGIPGGEPHPLERGQAVILSLRRSYYLNAPWVALPSYFAVWPLDHYEGIDPKSAKDTVKSWQQDIKKLKKFKEDSLKEMEAFDPAAVKRARHLLKEYPAFKELYYSRIEPAKEFRPVVALNNLEARKNGLKEIQTAWTDPIAEPFLHLDWSTMRALRILLYHEQPLKPLGEAFLKRPLLDDQEPDLRLTQPATHGEGFAETESEREQVRQWMVRHFSHLHADHEVATFARLNPKVVVPFFACFPHDSRYPAEIQLNPEGNSGSARPNEDGGNVLDEEVANTLLLLISSEDPGLSDFVLRPEWGYWTQMFNQKKGETGLEMFGKMRMPWIKDQILSWLKPETDNRYRKIALIVMHENPGDWVKAWIDDRRRAKNPLSYTDLAGPASGLGDVNFMLDLWKETLAIDGSEWNFVWWLRFTRCYDVRLARFALERWEKELVGVTPDKADEAMGQFEPYLSGFRVFTIGDRPGRFKSFEEAQTWLDEVEGVTTPVENR
ncbi:MAG: hypothetical protein M5U26_12140 [Planctomycetota bacterium]|nr:hypothetical protein [Planctomycetota bacterium]